MADVIGKTQDFLRTYRPDPALVERADYITEMKKIRHPFDKGVAARKGVEW